MQSQCTRCFPNSGEIMWLACNSEEMKSCFIIGKQGIVESAFFRNDIEKSEKSLFQKN